MAGLKTNPMVKKIVATGEAQVGKVVQQVLANEKFVSGIQTVVQTTLTAKGALDRNIRIALSAMNLPSVQDVEQIRAKVGELEAVLVKLDEKVTQLLDGQTKKAKA